MIDRRIVARVILLTVAALVASMSGCIFDSSEPTDPPEGEPPPEYVTADSPENALHNFYVALVTRDLEGYDGVLASDFTYVFPSDYPPASMGSCDGEWTRDEEMAAAERLFASPQVIRIDLDLPEAEAVPSTEIGLPEDAMRIRLTGVEFLVEDVGGTTYMARENTVYDMFFRPGGAGAGEDPASWYLFLWREMPPPNAPGPRLLSAPTPIQPIFWWEIKCEFGA